MQRHFSQDPYYIVDTQIRIVLYEIIGLVELSFLDALEYEWENGKKIKLKSSLWNINLFIKKIVNDKPPLLSLDQCHEWSKIKQSKEWYKKYNSYLVNSNIYCKNFQLKNSKEVIKQTRNINQHYQNVLEYKNLIIVKDFIKLLSQKIISAFWNQTKLMIKLRCYSKEHFQECLEILEDVRKVLETK